MMVSLRDEIRHRLVIFIIHAHLVVCFVLEVRWC